MIVNEQLRRPLTLACGSARCWYIVKDPSLPPHHLLDPHSDLLSAEIVLKLHLQAFCLST